MNIVSILYVFILFYVFTPGTVITLPLKSSKMVHCLIHALLFSIMLFLTYDIVCVTEGMKNKDIICNKCKKKDYCDKYEECREENPKKPCSWKHKMCKRCNKHCDNTTAPATTVPATTVPATTTPDAWETKLASECPSGRQCFSTNLNTRGHFSTMNGETSFQFTDVRNPQTGLMWDALTVARSWTNPNSYVDNGETNIPMKYIKVSV